MFSKTISGALQGLWGSKQPSGTNQINTHAVAVNTGSMSSVQNMNNAQQTKLSGASIVVIALAFGAMYLAYQGSKSATPIRNTQDSHDRQRTQNNER